jgi:hypothetical protein
MPIDLSNINKNYILTDSAMRELPVAALRNANSVLQKYNDFLVLKSSNEELKVQIKRTSREASFVARHPRLYKALAVAALVAGAALTAFLAVKLIPLCLTTLNGVILLGTALITVAPIALGGCLAYDAFFELPNNLQQTQTHRTLAQTNDAQLQGANFSFEEAAKLNALSVATHDLIPIKQQQISEQRQQIADMRVDDRYTEQQVVSEERSVQLLEDSLQRLINAKKLLANVNKIVLGCRMGFGIQ